MFGIATSPVRKVPGIPRWVQLPPLCTFVAAAARNRGPSFWGLFRRYGQGTRRSIYRRPRHSAGTRAGLGQYAGIPMGVRCWMGFDGRAMMESLLKSVSPHERLAPPLASGFLIAG